MYPSVSAPIFKAFVPETFDGPGEDGANLLSVDMAIDMSSTQYLIFRLYALVMIGVYPIGVPVLYALMLFKSRHELHELRLIELTQEYRREVGVESLLSSSPPLLC